jgi:predicted aspartyl protease
MKVQNIIVVIALLFCLVGCSLVNTIRIRNANDEIKPTWKNEQTKSELKTHYIGMRPYVEVALNGVDGFKFLIDTGASFSLLFDSEKVKKLNLKEGYQLQMHGWGDDGYSPAYQTSAESLSLANVSFSDVEFAYLPLSTSQYFLVSDELIFDGVIGHDVLHHFSWVFDKKANQISISKNPYELTGQEISIPFDVSLSKLTIDSKIDFGQGQKINRELVIDTGSRHYLKVNTAFLKENNIKLPETQITAADFGLSGQSIHPRVTLPNLQLAGLSLPNVKTNVIGNSDDDEDDYWIVGSALLNQSISVIDYHSSVLHLIPYEGSTFKSLYNLLGLELRKLKTGNFIVRYVFPQMATSTLDFKKGDIISKIDDQLAESISLEQWLNISNNAGSHQICRIRDSEKCFIVLSSEIKGYSIE